MNNEKAIRTYGWAILLTIVTLLSIILAGLMYSYNSAVPRGILGILTIYFLYYFGQHTKMDLSMNDFLRDTRKGKFFFAAFLVPIMSYWAAAQIYEMIYFIINK